MGTSKIEAVGLEEQVATQVRAALGVDETRLGEVWRLTRDGKSPDEIAEEFGTNTSNFVNKYLRFARALETGDLPSAPTMVRECARTFRRFVHRHPEAFSPDVRAILEQRGEELRAMAEDPEAIDQELSKIRRDADEAVRTAQGGIYVYTLPHYFNTPLVPANDESVLISRTLMKVGRSENDVIRRFRQQERNTALPEDPILLRIYTGVTDTASVEAQFHALMSAADHRRNRGRSAGTEWFMTSLEFLDTVARVLGMQTHYRVNDED